MYFWYTGYTKNEFEIYGIPKGTFGKIIIYRLSRAHEIRF